jgi:integrase/recombinase XerC
MSILPETGGAAQLALFAPPAALNQDAVSLFLENTWNPRTKRAYAADLQEFFTVVCGELSPAAVAQFLGLAPPQIALALQKFKTYLHERALSEAAINRKLAAVGALLKYAHRLGWCSTNGRGLVDREKVHSYRNTRGIELPWVQELLQLPLKLHGQPGKGKNGRPGEMIDTVRSLRDRAIFSLMFECGLRRSSVIQLDVGDFSNSMLSVMIHQKGKGTQKVPKPISKGTARDIAAYLMAAGHQGDKGPLFRNLHHDPGRRGRLTGDGLYHLIKTYGQELGIPELRPHDLRHSCGTQTSKATNGNAWKVKAILGHASIATSDIYVHNAEDLEREVVNLLSDLVRGGEDGPAKPAKRVSKKKK